MAFSGLTFPQLKLKHGISKQIIDPIMVTGNGAREVRRKQNKTDRGVWTFPARNISEADKQALVKFFQQTRMGADSFYFQDPTMPVLVDAPMASRSTNTFYFNVPFDAVTPGNHPIVRPVNVGLTVKLNGTPTTNYSFATGTDGLPYIQVTGATPTDTVTVSGAFYLVARFSGTLQYSIAAMQKVDNNCTVVPTIVELADFQIIEVFE